MIIIMYTDQNNILRFMKIHQRPVDNHKALCANFLTQTALKLVKIALLLYS